MPSSPAADPRSRRAARRVARRRRPALVGAVSVATLVALGGCGGGPAPRLYVLEPLDGESIDRVAGDGSETSRTGAADAGAAGARTPDVETDVATPVPGLDALGIAVVTLPGYARDPRIASRDGEAGIVVDDDHRWAESPEEAITRVLLERLRIRGGASVLSEPWPRGFEPDARVEVAFDRLLRAPDGGADATGRILLLSGDGRELVTVRPFRLVRTATSTAEEAFFVAVAALVDDIARLAIDALGAAREPA